MKAQLRVGLWLVLTTSVLALCLRDGHRLLEYSIGKAYSATIGPCLDFTQPLPVPPVPPGAQGDEFVGPFASWANLQRDYGAAGDGVTDDTNAIQRALVDLSTFGKSPVLYIPAGTYLVTQTVTLAAASNVAVIGADPNTTVIKWAGAQGGILFHIDGVAYSKFDRITFDGSSLTLVAVDQSLTGYAGGRVFDTGNEYADDVFQNTWIGIQGGQYGLGAAETSVIRSKFLNNVNSGILLKNFNALDWWVSYSEFENNGVGVSNNPGAGNFHVYDSVFKNSITADISILNTGTFNFRRNFSLNSLQFIMEAFYYTNAAVTRVSNNTVIIPPPPSGATGGYAMYQGNMGPTVMTDNVFLSPANSTQPPILINSQDPPDCVSVGNTYTVPNPVSCKSYANGVGRYISVDDQVVSASSVKWSVPVLPSVLPGYNRRVFDIVSGAGSAAIQQAISQAKEFCGQRPIVHLPYGTYNITQTIVVPAGCNIQLVGDGAQTRLQWSGVGTGPVILLQGPSAAILRDFYVNAGTATGILVQRTDQPNSRVYMQEVQLFRSSSANLFVDSLDYTNVELRNFSAAETATAPAVTGIGLQVIGGPQAQAGKPQYGRTSIFAGSSAANYNTFQVSKGGSLLVQDFYYEGPNLSTFAIASDNSTLTVEGSRIALPANNGDAIQLNNLRCNATVMSSAPDSDVRITGGQGGSALILGNNFGFAQSYYTLASTIFSAFSSNRRDDPSYGSRSIANMGATISPANIRAMLAQSRALRPTTIMDLPTGITDVRFYRVWVELGNIGIHLTR